MKRSFGRSETDRRTLPVIRDGLGTIPEVRDGSGDPPKGLGRVKGISESSGTGLGTLPEFMDGSGNHLGGPGRGGRYSGKSLKG